MVPPELSNDFPQNVVKELKASLTSMVGVDKVLQRPLKPTDPSGSVGIFATVWNPEGWQIGQYDPAVTQYGITVQTFVKHGSEEVGIALHSKLAKRLRVMLYRDEELRLRLGSLSTTEGAVVERAQRWGIRNQRYLSNEFQGNFLFLAVTEMWLQTEIV
jgi:hypothetical protein